LRANREISIQRTDRKDHRRTLRAVILTILLAPIVAPLFCVSAWAQANLPPVGSLNDYVHEGADADGGSTAPVPPQAYQPQPAPPQGYVPYQGNGSSGMPSQESNNQYVDPNAARDALIGAAVVGAVALGVWAFQQHEIHQAQRRARYEAAP